MSTRSASRPHAAEFVRRLKVLQRVLQVIAGVRQVGKTTRPAIVAGWAAVSPDQERIPPRNLPKWAGSTLISIGSMSSLTESVIEQATLTWVEGLGRPELAVQLPQAGLSVSGQQESGRDLAAVPTGIPTKCRDSWQRRIPTGFGPETGPSWPDSGISKAGQRESGHSPGEPCRIPTPGGHTRLHLVTNPQDPRSMKSSEAMRHPNFGVS